MEQTKTLYRKYRPRKLSEVVGQDHVKRYLKNAVDTNSLAHAFLFSGIRGTGKTSLARIIAMIVNCENGPSIEYDLEDKIVKAILEKKCPDYIELDAASKKSIEDIREIRNFARNVPMMCRKKVFVVDEVHCLSKNAVSAMLKILEEPPEHTMFILATTEPHNILETIRSRCCCFSLKNINFIQIKERLKYICDKEGYEYEEPAIDLIAKAGRGSLRDSISVLGSILTSCKDIIKTEVAVDNIGSNGQDYFLSMLGAIWKKDKVQALDLLHQAYATGMDGETVLAALLEHVHDMMVAKSIGSYDHLYIDDAIKEKWVKIMQGIDLVFLMYIDKSFHSISNYIKTTLRPDLLLESTIFGIIEKRAHLES